VQLLVEGNAPRRPQSADGATYEPIMKKDLAQVIIVLIYLVQVVGYLLTPAIAITQHVRPGVHPERTMSSLGKKS